MSLIVRRCFSRSRLVEELVEAWQIDHTIAMLAHDAEELVQECLGLKDLIHGDWISIRDSVLTGEVCDEAVGRMGKMAVEKSLLAMTEVKNLVLHAESMGFHVEGAQKLTDGIVETEKIRTNMLRLWPEIDKAAIEATLECYKRGDFKTVEDLLNESQGCGSGISASSIYNS